MRIVIVAAMLAMGTVPATAAFAQAAAAKASTGYTTEDTDLGTLLDDPAAKAIVVKYLPEIASSEQIDMARGLTLKAMQQYAPDKVTDDALAKIDAEFAKLPKK